MLASAPSEAAKIGFQLFNSLRQIAPSEADPKMLTNVDTTMGDFERKEFHAALRNQVLESDKFPTIKFTSVSVSNVQRDGDKRSFTLNGDLTVHGVTKRVAFPVSATISDSHRVERAPTANSPTPSPASATAPHCAPVSRSLSTASPSTIITSGRM